MIISTNPVHPGLFEVYKKDPQGFFYKLEFTGLADVINTSIHKFKCQNIYW